MKSFALNSQLRRHYTLSQECDLLTVNFWISTSKANCVIKTRSPTKTECPGLNQSFLLLIISCPILPIKTFHFEQL